MMHIKKIKGRQAEASFLETKFSTELPEMFLCSEEYILALAIFTARNIIDAYQYQSQSAKRESINQASINILKRIDSVEIDPIVDQIIIFSEISRKEKKDIPFFEIHMQMVTISGFISTVAIELHPPTKQKSLPGTNPIAEIQEASWLALSQMMELADVLFGYKVVNDAIVYALPDEEQSESMLNNTFLKYFQCYSPFLMQCMEQGNPYIEKIKQEHANPADIDIQEKKDAAELRLTDTIKKFFLYFAMGESERALLDKNLFEYLVS